MSKVEHEFPDFFERRLNDFLGALTQQEGQRYKTVPGGLKKNWEAYHFSDYAKKVAVKVSRSVLDAELDKRGLGTYQGLRDVSTRKGFTTRHKQSRRILQCLADVQEISLLQCFADLLEHCWKNSLPLVIYNDDPDSEELKNDIASIREYIRNADREAAEIPSNPYKGLQYFTEEDRDVFFGRADLVEEVSERVKMRPFTAIIGASGSGKSSLIYAGVIPKIKATRGWLPIEFRPSSSKWNDPFHALARAIELFYFSDEGLTEKADALKVVANKLKNGSLDLVTILDEVQSRHPEDKLLIVIDQFEELFSLGLSDADINVFITLLSECIKSISRSPETSKVAIVVVFRSDYLSQINRFSAFAKLVSQNATVVYPLDHVGLRQAIEKPAEALKVKFEPRLVDLIISDAEGSPGSLPLIESALTELWEMQTGGQITHVAYQNVEVVQWSGTPQLSKIDLTEEEKQWRPERSTRKNSSWTQ